MRLLGGFGLRVAAVMFVILMAGTITLYWFSRDLPEVGNLAEARKQPRITVHDQYGEVIGIHGQDRGTPVDAADLPDHVVAAFIATEDRNFFYHVGVNPVAILRALTVNVKEGGVAQGGSTITQQLVKNLLLTPERTLKRKVEELLLSLKIESRYSKDEILSLYLNAVYFGNGAYGLEAAARRYFGKTPHTLSVGEAAMLAGLLKAPSRLSPTSSLAAARRRAQVVINAMVSEGVLSKEEAAQIIVSGVAETIPEDLRLNYAVDHAVAEAKAKLVTVTDDIAVWTTIDTPLVLDLTAQRAAVAAADPLYTDDVQTAALILEEEGAIRALIGGNDYASSVYNRATQAKRQPGSVFKPFVYLAAVEAGYRPEEGIEDEQIKIGRYEPTNYKDRYLGLVTLTEAMARSANSAAVRLQEEIGRHKVVDAAQRAGFTAAVDIGPALALGVLETSPLIVAQSFLPFSNGGIPTEPYVVAEITDSAGKTLYRHTPDLSGEPVFSRETLRRFDHMMRAVVTRGSGFRARVPGHYVAGKTGTSQGSRDAWFAGYASGMVGVVWLGKDDDTPMTVGKSYISGSGAPAVLWGKMMKTALKGKPRRRPYWYYPVLPPLPSPEDEKEESLVSASDAATLDQLSALLQGEDGRRPTRTLPNALPSTEGDPLADLIGRMP